jgi:hypothetical protein
MMLSVSMQHQGQEVDLTGIIEGADAVDEGIPHGKVLTRFAEAVLGGDEAEITKTRENLIDAVGGDAVVDAAGVIGHFERMTRVADATGIPLDEATAAATVGIREDLGLNDYSMASRTLD